MTIVSRYRGKCAACNCFFEAGARIEWVQGRGARHLTSAECSAALQARADRPQVVSGAHLAIAQFLTAARARGLRFPNVRFLAPDGRSELRLWLAGAQSKAPGSVQVSVGGDWIGRVEPNGTVAGRRLENAPDILATLTRIAADPARAAREYGALTAHCSFCNRALTDEGSVEVGYGGICALHYGLPHEARGSKQLREVPCQPNPEPVSTVALERGARRRRPDVVDVHASAV
jgi:hypothetical protein